MSEKAMEAFLKHKELMDEAENIGEDYYALEFRKLRDESDRLKSDPTYSTKDGEKPCNLIKNRYKDILPFDYNRVKLKETSEADNDYINASFIKGIGNQCYIAAQGPLPKTVSDFWSVIWDYNVRVVIMACQEYEGCPAKLKCFRYWNQDLTEELVFGKITVKMVAESFLPDTNRAVVKRTLALLRNNGETRTVIQIHHTRWPDKFIPTCVDSILALLKQTRDYHAEDRIEPVLFHCSAGCGRTGSLIVIDYVWSMLKKVRIPDKFSLFEVIVEMRKQRMAMVQSLDQYQFVYGAVAKLFLGDYSPPLPQKGALRAGVGRTSSNNSSREGHSTAVHSASSSCQDLRNFSGWTWGNDSDKSGDAESSLPFKPPRSSLRKRCSNISSEDGTYANVYCPISAPEAKSLNFEKPRFVKTTGYTYRGHDIGFPNRIRKPSGPRPMPPAQKTCGTNAIKVA